MLYFKKIYYNKYSKRSFSISNVDLIIDKIFSNLKKGIYIDIGCNHPIKYNNTYLLNKKGWTGINVDLDDDTIKEFKKYRPYDYNISTVVSDQSNIVKEVYFYHKRSAINTISKELADFRKTKPENIVKKKTKTIEQIIEESPFKEKKINLLTIDIENHEYEALKNFDFKKYNIEVIVTELLNLNQKKLEIYTQSLEFVTNSKIYNLIVNKNYKLVNWVHSDLVFVRNDIKL